MPGFTFAQTKILRMSLTLRQSRRKTNLEAMPDSIDHVAISVKNIAASAAWYQEHFHCEVLYQDDTWAMLQFANIKLALVVEAQHPPHLGFFTPRAAEFGELKLHRDGTRSVYITDPDGNNIEMLPSDTVPNSKS
jgi:catechol 2,3-dioxygenase-like lactoylglutathione lyase family enzyme